MKTIIYKFATLQPVKVTEEDVCITSLKDDEDMMKTVESVRDYGVMTPIIARPDPDGGYEIISGHRRHHASELAGKDTIPVIIREMCYCQY